MANGEALDSSFRNTCSDVLTEQQEAGVGAPQFVDGHACVVSIIPFGNIKKHQLGQRPGVYDLHPVEAVKDPGRRQRRR